jgi:hypothetical protein
MTCRYRVQRGAAAFGRRSLAVPGQPFLEVILVGRQPAALMPHVTSHGLSSR